MIDRRLFVRGLSAAVATASTLATDSALAQASQADTEAARQIARATDNSPFRLGVIGPGSRGNELVRSFLRVPGVKVVAAADVYPPRFAQLNEACGYQVATHADYRALLDRKDLDAIIVATPLGLHAQHVLPALEAGHHVYGEKTMAYTIEDAAKVVHATSTHKRIFQVGHQYRYSPWIRAAVARVQQGEIGDVTHILAYWNRNNNWRRPVPDPSLERLLNWRLYNQWSLGLLAELGSHHMDIANWVFGSTPTAALASGSICMYHDGRETDDNVQAILSYSGGRRFIFTSMTDNAKMGQPALALWNQGFTQSHPRRRDLLLRAPPHCEDIRSTEERQGRHHQRLLQSIRRDALSRPRQARPGHHSRRPHYGSHSRLRLLRPYRHKTHSR